MYSEGECLHSKCVAVIESVTTHHVLLFRQVISQALVSATNCVAPEYALHVRSSYFPNCVIVTWCKLILVRSQCMYAHAPLVSYRVTQNTWIVLLSCQRIPVYTYSISCRRHAHWPFICFAARQGSPNWPDNLHTRLFIPEARAMATLLPVANAYRPRTTEVRIGGSALRTAGCSGGYPPQA